LPIVKRSGVKSQRAVAQTVSYKDESFSSVCRILGG
jgi:hypothetical protein